jgi:PmbA protein
MEKLLALAQVKEAQAEIYQLAADWDMVSFENGRLKDITSSLQSGLSLRLIKDRKIGFTYTRNLTDREELLKSGLVALRMGADAHFDFPRTEAQPELDTFDPSIEELNSTQLVAECQRVHRTLSAATKAQIDIQAYKTVLNQRVLNSSGTDLSSKSSGYYLQAMLVLPGGSSGIRRAITGKSFVPASDEYLDFLIGLANPAFQEARPQTGNMKVLFMPEAMYALTWRLKAGTSGKGIFHKESPVADKLDQKIFDEKLTIYDDPRNDRMPLASAFDSEGTPTRKLPIVERGVLKSFYYDLEYAGRMKTTSTGHGNRNTMFGGDPITIKPSPGLDYLYIAPGSHSFEDLIKTMDRGIIVNGVLGAHSGNIPNGDFSIGLSPGLYVENGVILGRVNEAMIAGNVYELLKEIVAIEDRVQPGFGGFYPSILFDNVRVATRN